MKQTLAFVLFILPFCGLEAQQLYFEALTGLNRTAYESEFYPDPQSYYSIGARLAGGADHVQIGGEFRTNLSNPAFEFSNRREEHSETYYGAFIRGKISKYPAMGFGLVLRGGAGFYNYETRYENFLIDKLKYDPVLGFNGGLGVSIPAFKVVMLELGYTYNYLDKPEITDVPGVLQLGYKSAYHSFQAGLSFNFVFGDRAKQYRHLQENWRWRNGWRG